uniref:IQ domain-containing protein E n=1 Tax=Jaculus jaculus TaxID=51337 RepID=A0A8C5NU65_JACJA
MSLGVAEETGDDSLSAVTFDSDFETNTKRKVCNKPPSTSPKSPYYSKPRKVPSWRPLRTAGSMPLSSRVSLTPQKLWLGTSKQGATSVYREKEDMYDEIIELKKSLHMQKSDVDLMRTKLRRLEEENSRKDRQIEQLLDPGRGSDFVRTLAEKRPDTGWVITGLKQRVFRLEQQCKEKDSTINKLQTDLKTTNLEEMRIAMETYYEEIHRLQTLLASPEATAKKPPMEKKLGMKRQKKMGNALLNLTRSVQELTEENQSLKEDLDRVLSNSPTIFKIKGYVDWSKPRLLRRIAELEKKISSMENPKVPTSEQSKLNPLAHSSSNISVNMQSRGDQPEDQEHLQEALKSLRGEQSTLQAQLLEKEEKIEELRQAKADLEKELETARVCERERHEREQALKEEIETLTKKCEKLEEAKRQERDAPKEVAHEAFGELHMSSSCSGPLQQNSQPESSSSEGGSRPTTPCSDGRREAAARTLQARWKAHRHKKRKAALDEAAVVLQAAFRGHVARLKLLSSKAPASRSPSGLSLLDQSSPMSRVPSPKAQAKGSPEQEEAVILIQSVLRGHLARARFSALREGAATARTLREAATASHWETASPRSLEASGQDSETSSGEAAEDEDEAEESASLQSLAEVIRAGLFAKEEQNEAAVVDHTPSTCPSIPTSIQGGHWGCLSPPSLEAEPCSSLKDVSCLDVCEESSSNAGSSWPSLAEPSPSGLQPLAVPFVEDISSDDSDDIIIAPCLPRKKSLAPF